MKKKSIRLSTANKKELFKKGYKIHFFNEDYFEDTYYEDIDFTTAEIVKVNKNSVKAVNHAKSGWETDEHFNVQYDDILAVINENELIILK